MIDNIILYVELDGQIWAVMASGKWFPLSDINLLDSDLPLITNIEKIIEMQASGEFTFSYNNQTFVIDSQALQFGTTPNYSAENTAQQINPTISSGGGLGATTRLTSDNDEVLADAGYQTRDFTLESVTVEQANNELVGKLRNEAQITISIEDGIDTTLNQYEVPTALIYGSANQLEDGRVVVVSITDSQGAELQFSTLIENNSWSLGAVDLSALSEGAISLTAVVTDRYGNFVDALTASQIDTLASIEEHFEASSNDNVINQFEVGNEALFGSVTEVEDGQQVEVVVTDINGYSETFLTDVIEGEWRVEEQDLSAFSEGLLTAVATVADVAGNVSTVSASSLKDTKAEITIQVESEDGIINLIESTNTDISGGVQFVEDEQLVSIIITDENDYSETFEAIVSDGQWNITAQDLSQFSDGLLTVEASVEDIAGNVANSTTSVIKDVVASITVEIDSGDDDVINLVESAETILSGQVSNVEDGQSVTVNITDINGDSVSFNTLVVASAWSLSAELSTLNDGELTVTASVIDIAGNATSSVATSIKDSVASLDIHFEDEADDNVINQFEVGNETLFGSVNNVEDGQTVSIVVTDSNNYSETYSVAISDGQWAIDNNDLSAFAEGQLTAVASTLDLAGNIATSTTTITKDTYAQISLSLESGEDGWLNSDEIQSASLSGQVFGVEDGQMVQIIATDSNGLIKTNTAEVIDGKYSLSGINLTGVSDGTLNVVALISDKAGNPVSTANNVEVDIHARIVTHISSNGDNLINAAEVTNTNIWGFTIKVDDGEQVTLEVSDVNGDSLIFTTTTTDNLYSITEDLSSLAEGQLTVTATVTDDVGNQAVATDNAIKDTIASITLVIEDGGDNWLNASEILSASASGDAIGIEDGQVVTIVATDSENNSAQITTTVADGKFSVSGLNLSAFVDGNFSATATVSDIAGNPASASDTVLIDTLATLSLNINASGDGVLNAVEVPVSELYGHAEEVNDGAIVHIVVTDSLGKTLSFDAVVTDNSYSIIKDLSSLDDGVLTASASVIDEHGNTASADASVEKDTLAAVTIVIETGGDGYLNEFEVGDVSGSGTVTNVENGNPITVVLTDSDGNTSTTNTVVIGGQYTFSGVDLAGFVDGNLTAVATVNDNAGNPASAQTVLQIETFATISVAIDSGSDDVLNSNEIGATRLYGTTNSIEDGQIVSISVTDSVGKVFVFTANVLNDAYQVLDADLSSLAEGTLTVNAFATDSYGNQAADNTTVLKDTLASISIDVESGEDNTLNGDEVSSTLISGTTTNIEDGRQAIITVTDGTNTLTFDTFINANSWSITNANLSTLKEGELTFTASASDVAGNDASSSTQVNKDTLAEVTITFEQNNKDDLLNQVESVNENISGTVTNIENGQFVSVSVTDAVGGILDFSAQVIAGHWLVPFSDLSSLQDGALDAEVTAIDQAGNVITATSSIIKDTSATITVVIESGADQFINATEVSAVLIHGVVSDVPDDATVTLTITDINGNQISPQPTTTVVNGAWSITPVDLSLLDEGLFNVSAEVTDNAGNIATGSDEAVKDVLAETLLTIDDHGDGYLNSVEITNVTLSGSVTHVEDGQEVNVTITDIDNHIGSGTATIVDGRWQVDGLNLSHFSEGDLTAVATIVDSAGNIATATDVVTKDTTIELTVGIVSGGDNMLNLAEVNALVTVLGNTVGVEDGREVSFTISDGVNDFSDTAFVNNGVWSYENIDFSVFSDGNITIDATISDLPGNITSASSSVIKDTQATITVDIKTDSHTDDDVINLVESTQTQISGTTQNVDDGQVVTVEVVDGAGNSLTFTTTVNAGVWDLPAINLSGLVDGTNNITATATVSDIAGNTDSASDTTSKDTQANITVTIGSGSDDYLNSAEIVAGTRIFGDVTNVENNKTVTLIINDQSGNQITVDTTIEDGSYELTGVDLSSLNDGLLEVNVQVIDAAGNIATASDTAIKDIDVSIDIDTDSNNGFSDYPGFNSYSFMTGGHSTLGGTTTAEAGQVVTLTVTDGVNTVNFDSTVDNSGRWLISNIDVTGLDNTLTWDMQVDVDDVAGNHATDQMPTLNLADHMLLAEQNMNNTPDAATTFLDIYSENTTLSFTDNQPQLAAITSEGQSVTAVLSADGLSIEVRRDGDGSLVLSASIDPVSSSASVTIFEAVDHADGSNELLTELFIKALQTDADGTTERSVMPIVFNIIDSIPTAVDDTYTVTEAQTSSNNLLVNDSAVDGEPIVNAVTFNGTTTAVSVGADAVIDTGKGILTVSYDGNWQFLAAHNLDNSIAQQVSFDYQIVDYDGDTSDATVVFDIIDGDVGQMDNLFAEHSEPSITQATNFDKVFTINAGSDDLVATSIAFLGATQTYLEELNLESSGETINYSLNADNNMITATTIGDGTVFTIALSAVNSGADLTATATFTQQMPIDHLSSDNVKLALGITANDTDGSPIDYGVINWTVNDGDNASIVNDNEASLNEADLSLGNVVEQGTFVVTPGSDETSSVVFDINKQPDLTSGGQVILYKLDGSGNLIAYTDSPEETIFTVEIIGLLEMQTLSNLSYEVTLMKAVDQLSEQGEHLDVMKVAIVVSVTDGDNDITDQNLLINISDSGDPVITGGTLHVTEIPLSPTTPSSFSETDTTLINISADLDPIIDIKLDVNTHDLVLLSDGSTLTKNGESVLWQENNDGSYKGVLANGEVIFELILPENIDISAGNNADVSVTFNMVSAVDHNKADHDNNLDITLPIIAIDSDFTEALHEVNVRIDDGENPSLLVNDSLTVDENVLLTGNDSDTIKYQLDQGSDDIVAVEPLLAGQVIPNLFSHGHEVAFAGTANSDGWWLASSSEGNVLKIRFNLDGSINLKLLDVVDHPNSGEDTLTLSFDIQAIDADGDISNLVNNSVDINIIDDLPESQSETVILVEGQSTDLHLLASAQITGADGATITGIAVNGDNYLPGNWIELKALDGTPYGQILINSDGEGRLETYSEVYHNGLDILDGLSYTVTDGDGDEVTSYLLMDIADEIGEVTITSTATLEDTSLLLDLKIYVGDTDNNENVEEVFFTVDSLAGGTLTLNNVLLTPTDGKIILSNFTSIADGVYIPVGELFYHPKLNSSDQSQLVTLSVSAEISKDGSPNLIVGNNIDLTITSVADTPTWNDGSSDYQYTIDEDGGEQSINISADLFDSDGSEVLTYQIGQIETGLTITLNGVALNTGDTLSASDISDLKAIPAANFAGVLTFSMTPIATELENNDSINGAEKVITLNVSPVADTPELAVVNAKGFEDEIILLKEVLNGQLIDTDGSETLSYVITVESGWSVVAINGSNAVVTELEAGKYQVEATDVEAAQVGLLPALHVSSANGVFNFSAQAVSTESTQEGIVPSQETATSIAHDFQVFLKGVVDAPTVVPGDGWTFDATTQIIRNENASEDTPVSLAIGITTADQDGSENINVLIANLPDGVTITNNVGVPSELAIVAFENGKPVYQVTLAELQDLYINPVSDFSGLIEFDIQTVITEADGDAKPDGEDDHLYQLKVEIDVQPVIDNTGSTIDLSASGIEDLLIPLDMLPDNIADVDGSETVTGFSIDELAAGMTLYFDGVVVTGLPINLENYTDATSPTLSELLDSGRFAVQAPTDQSGAFNVEFSYQVTDTSGSGEQISETFSEQILTVNVSAEVEDLLSPENTEIDDITRLEGVKTVQISEDGSPISLAGLVTFYDQDNDGSEVIDYLIIVVPEADNWVVTHPDGAIHDGDGRWLIPATGLTSDSIQEDAIELLADVEVYTYQASLLPQVITIGARVVDGDDALMVSTNVHVHFKQDGVESNASASDTLATIPIIADEDTDINIGGQTLNSITNDGNDNFSFRVLASDLPLGGTITGSDVIVVYDRTGQSVFEYLFTEASLGDLKLTDISDHFAGTFEVPISVISTDRDSGDTLTEIQTLQFEIAPLVDGFVLEAGTAQILEDTYTVLDLSTAFIDSNITNQGVEVLNSLQLTLPFPLGGAFIAPPGVITNMGSGVWVVNDLTKIDEILYKGPLNYSGNVTIDFTATVVDTAAGYSGSMQDTDTVTGNLTIEVIPVTDKVNITTDNTEGSEDTSIALTGLTVGFVDNDGSEIMSIEISGVPTGAVLVLSDGTILPNNGTDGGTFNGQPTYKWSVTETQLSTLEIKPPLDFSGDIPMKVTVIGYEEHTSDYVTTEGSFILEVLPVGDDAQIFSVPEDLTGTEGQVTHFDISGESTETNSNETLRLTVTVTQSDTEEGLAGLDRIRIDGQEATFTQVDGEYTASLDISAAEMSGFDLLSGADTFGLLNIQIDLQTIDKAIVGGVEKIAYGAITTFDTTLNLVPSVDIPDLTLNADSIFATIGSTAPLAIDLSLINPATGEAGYVEITGVPAGISISDATESGGVWTVSQANLATAMLTGLTAEQNFNLNIVPVAELDGDSVSGVGQTLAVNIVAANGATVGDGDNNIIVTGSGDSNMSGGNGNDQFVFNSADQGTPATDHITDFNTGSDSINLTDLLSSVSVPTGGELADVIDLTENLGSTTISVKLDEVTVTQNIVLDNTSINDLYGEDATGINESIVLDRLLEDHIIITGQYNAS